MELRHFLATLILAPALLAPLSSHADPRYTVALLPEHFTPSDINNSGQMTGSFDTGDGAAHLAIYSGNAVTDFGSLFSGNSSGFALNDARQVAGVSYGADGVAHGFLFDNGVVTELGAGTIGFGINAQGDVVGQQLHDGGTLSAILYRKDYGVTELPLLGTGNIATARDINDTGKIVGESNIDSELHAPFHPFVYSRGHLRDLGTLANMETNSAQAINNAGQIAGSSEAADGTQHAFLYQHGTLTDVGGFDGLYLNVEDINEHGAFVGSSWTPTGTVGYLYADGALIALNDLVDPSLGWNITSATGINDSGQISAFGCRDYVCGGLRLDVATAVPEPQALAMLVAGLALFTATRRRLQRP